MTLPCGCVLQIQFLNRCPDAARLRPLSEEDGVFISKSPKLSPITAVSPRRGRESPLTTPLAGLRRVQCKADGLLARLPVRCAQHW